MSDVTFVVALTIERDDTQYLVSVYRKPDGFFAFWECCRCQEESRLIDAVLDRETAIERCKEQIGDHRCDGNGYWDSQQTGSESA